MRKYIISNERDFTFKSFTNKKDAMKHSRKQAVDNIAQMFYIRSNGHMWLTGQKAKNVIFGKG